MQCHIKTYLKTKIKTKEHNNRQNVNIWIRNLDTNKARQEANLETTRLRGRPRNRQQDKVREDARIVGGERWQEKLYNRKE
jgi:hypothetical protein